MRVYVSEEAHSSIDKAMDILGLGKKNLIKIKVDENFKMDITTLKNKIKNDIKKKYLPIGVIGTAGTTNTGSIDPLDKISNICKEFNLWFMVDAAYGGPAASISTLNKKFSGMQKADSILIAKYFAIVSSTTSTSLLADKNKIGFNFFSNLV